MQIYVFLIFFRNLQKFLKNLRCCDDQCMWSHFFVCFALSPSVSEISENLCFLKFSAFLNIVVLSFSILFFQNFEPMTLKYWGKTMKKHPNWAYVKWPQSFKKLHPVVERYSPDKIVGCLPAASDNNNNPLSMSVL